jgi:hypothetical protein
LPSHHNDRYRPEQAKAVVAPELSDIVLYTRYGSFVSFLSLSFVSFLSLSFVSFLSRH